MKNICVFCGSSPGADPAYAAAAAKLGRALVEAGLGLVYGGAGVGLMGTLAETVLDAGGRVTGVIPRALAEREVALTRLEDLRVVASMHERKALMAELSDGFIALPGGIGTLEEFVEVLTWAQLGIHSKPCALLNVCGYYDGLLVFFDRMAEQRFLGRNGRDLMLVGDDPAGLLTGMRCFRPPVEDKAAWALGMSGT